MDSESWRWPATVHRGARPQTGTTSGRSRYGGLLAACLLALAGLLGGALPHGDLAATPASVWRDTPAPYGPLFVLIAAAAVLLGGSLTAVIVILRLLALAGLLAIATCLPSLARRCGVPVERALWVALAGPLVGMHLLGGPHNDALMIAAVVAGLVLLASGARSPAVQVAAGVVLGLAVAIKITAVVVVPFAVLIAVRRPARPGPAAAAASRVGGAAAATMVVVTWVSGLGVGWVAGMAHTRDLVQFTSPPTAIGMTLTYAGQPLLAGFDAVPAVRLIALLMLAVVLAGLWLRSATTEGDPVRAALRGAALASTAMVALAPSFHPWYLVFPLVLLGATTVRTDLAMAAGAAASLLVLPDGGGLARFAKFPGAPLMTVLIVVFVVHRLRRVTLGTRLAGAATSCPSTVSPSVAVLHQPVDPSRLHR